MRIAILLSRFAVGAHGPIDFANWRTGRALTGTESTVIHAAQGLAELGHKVDLYCADAAGTRSHGGFTVLDCERPLSAVYDATISVSDPRLLDGCLGFRVNWSHAATFFGDPADVDAHVFVSPTQRAHVLAHTGGINPAAAVWIPNTIDTDDWLGAQPPRRLHSMAWLSSPDRGLHRLLELWPRIRACVPDAELRIYYRFDPYIDGCLTHPGLHGDRARYIASAITTLGRNGENGIRVMGPLPHAEFVRELRSTSVVAYTYDPPGPMAEAFCIGLLAACASGCEVLCSDQDALGDNFADIAEIIPGLPGNHQIRWADAITWALTAERPTMRLSRQLWARQFDRRRVAGLWDRFLRANVFGGRLDTSMMPTSIKEFAPCT